MNKPDTKVVNEETWNKDCQWINLTQRLSINKYDTKVVTGEPAKLVVNEETWHKVVNEETCHKGCQWRNLAQRLSTKKPATKAVNEEPCHKGCQWRNTPLRCSTKKPTLDFNEETCHKGFQARLLEKRGIDESRHGSRARHRHRQGFLLWLMFEPRNRRELSNFAQTRNARSISRTTVYRTRP